MLRVTVRLMRREMTGNRSLPGSVRGLTENVKVTRVPRGSGSKS